MTGDVGSLERACFEVGIKFGSLYHQFVGTPISPTSVRSLEAAIAESIANQPHCVGIEVTIDRDFVESRVDAHYGYTELAGEMLDCRIEVEVDGSRAIATIGLVDGYPKMELIEIDP